MAMLDRDSEWDLRYLDIIMTELCRLQLQTKMPERSIELIKPLFACDGFLSTPSPIILVGSCTFVKGLMMGLIAAQFDM